MKTQYTIRDSLLVMTIAFCGGLLTSADTLSKWAERMEYGTVRDESIQTANTIQSFGAMLGMGEISGQMRAGFRSLQQYSFATATVMGSAPAITTVSVKNHTMVRSTHLVTVKTNVAKLTTTVKRKSAPNYSKSAVTQLWGTLYESILRNPERLTPQPDHVNSMAAIGRSRDRTPVTVALTQRTTRPTLQTVPKQPSSIRRSAPPSEATQADLTNPSVGDSANATKKPNVLIVGDSLMGGVGPRLKRLLRKEHGFPSPKLKWKASTGLSRPDYFDWPKTLNKLLSEKNYDVVVAIFGTNDTQPVSVNRKSYRYGTKSWFAHYRKRVVKVLDMMCKSEGRAVYWIGLPTMRSTKFNEKIRKMNALYRQELNRSTCGQYIPMDKILSPDGQFSSYLRVGKKRKKVRAGDGIHLSFTGYDYVARRVIDTILAQTQANFLQNEMPSFLDERAL